ncbi:MAG: phage tail length tape measure family protein, partial [Alphaproteobacteria bacterium]
MADRSLAVRLAVKDAPQVLAALKATFGEGSNIVRSFQQQLEPTNRDLQRLENRLDSVARGTRAFAADEAKLGQLLAADRISLQRHNELLELSRQRYIAGASAARTHAAAMAGAKQAADAHTGAVRLQAYQVNNLFQQLQDVAVQLQGGTNPFTILVQQGPQATSAVGGVSNAVALLRAAISPTTVVALALAGSLGVLTARAAANESAIRAVAVGLQATGRTGQITAQQIDGAIDTMARLPNVTRAAARDLAALWGANPNIGPARFQQLAASVSDFATALRVDIPAAGAAFDKAMTSPTQTLIELDKQLDLKVSPSLLDTARRLEAVGLKAGAQAILLDALRPRLAGLAETAQGPLARALDGVKKNYDELMDSLADTTPVQASLAALQGWLGVLNQIVKLGPVNLGALVNPTVVAQALITGKVPGEKETVPRTRIDTSDVEADLARVRRQLQDTQRAAADLSALMERGPGGGREAEAAWQRQTDEAERYRREIEDLTRKIRDLVQAREAAATAPPMATAFASRAAGDDELGIPPGFYESASGGQSGSQERKITAEQINAAIDAYNPLAAQLRELKDKEEILRIGLERLNEEIAKGGKAAEDAAKRHAAGALALEQNIAQQKALKTSAQQAAEQAQVEIRVSRVAQGERERARVAAQAQLEAEHRGMRVDEQRVYVASKISEWEARKAAALRDSADAASLETVEALKVAAAWEGGAGAANLATAAMQARLAKLRDASIDEEEYTQRLLDQAAAQQLIAGGKAVDDLRQLVAAQSAVAAAAGLSAEAQAEVARQNEVAKFSAEQLAKATDGTREAAQKQIASYDELTKKRLADTQAAERQKAVQQALTTA